MFHQYLLKKVKFLPKKMQNGMQKCYAGILNTYAKRKGGLHLVELRQ